MPTIPSRTESQTERRLRVPGWFIVLLIVVGAVGGIWVWWRSHAYKAAMETIEAAIVAGRYAVACRDLNALLSWNRDSSGGIVYLLGSCELARGRNQAAAEAWARVAPGAAFSERAIRSRMRLLQDSGQLAAAERLIEEAALDPRNDPTALFVLLVPIYEQQGRITQAESLIERRWQHLDARGEGALEPAIKLVRQHIDLTVNRAAVGTLRSSLGKSARLAPDDDRVWLGLANLAIREGALEEAARWLDRCRQRRPRDIAVQQAWLSYSIAANRADDVREAMAHVPAAELPLGETHRALAWLAAQSGDSKTEARELESLLALAPADSRALDRLAELAGKNGQPAQAADYTRRKAEAQERRALFERLHNRKQPIRDARKLAQLAEQLGRLFDARGFLTQAIADNPGQIELRRDLERVSQKQKSAAVATANRPDPTAMISNAERRASARRRSLAGSIQVDEKVL